AYLHPAMRRPNLTVRVRAYATKVLLEGARAVGIEYRQRGRTVQVRASREVILSGGAFNTPQLLMLSGVGPADHLREVGIEPVLDLPVGKNLQDHLAVLITFSRPDAGEFRGNMPFDRMGVNMIRAYLLRSRPATVV